MRSHHVGTAVLLVLCFVESSVQRVRVALSVSYKSNLAIFNLLSGPKFAMHSASAVSTVVISLSVKATHKGPFTLSARADTRLGYNDYNARGHCNRTH